MNQQELYEAGEILLEEIERWEKPEDGNVISNLCPANDQDADFVVTIYYYPKSFGEAKIATRPMFSLGEDEWEDAKDGIREHFRDALHAIRRQWEAESARRDREAS